MTAMHLLYGLLMICNGGKLTVKEASGMITCLFILTSIGIIHYLICLYTVKKLSRQLDIHTL